MLPTGRHELDLQLAFADAPAGAVMDGRVWLDGRPLARIGPLSCQGRREAPIVTLPLKYDARLLRIEGGPLRLTRLVVHKGDWRKLRPMERLRNAERRLRALVAPPRRVPVGSPRG